MADETLTPQAGELGVKLWDVWVRDDETRFVIDVEGRDQYVFFRSSRATGGVTAVAHDWREWASKATLLVREHESVSPPTPAQGGDVITVECPIFVEERSGNLRISGTAFNVLPPNEDAIVPIRHVGNVPIIVDRSMLTVPSLPPVTAVPK